MTNLAEKNEAPIDLVRSGDPEAIDALVERYKRPLFAFILRYVDDYATAEDTFQETWLRVIRSLHTFRGDAKFSTWLFQIALNICRDGIRKKSGRVFVPMEEIEEPSCNPDIDPERLMRSHAVRQMIRELPPKMKEAILLRYYHNMDDTEIAAVTGCPVGTVKTRCHRAIKILSKKWELRSR